MVKRYADAGVDIDAGDAFAAHIRSIESKAVASASSLLAGGFAGAFELDTSRFRNPVILSTTDGVGTKLLVARTLGRYETVGIDLVAMCVNDLLVHGAEPVQFLDYIACARIDRSVLDPILAGIVKGCEQAECALSGGETAELPDMYETGSVDLAGFAVGVAERDRLLPKTDAAFGNALLYGLESSGIHSNGLSLARAVITPEDGDDYAELLRPTRIYTPEMRELIEADVIAGAAHVTGGGIEANTARALPDGVRPRLDYGWHRPRIFETIASKGSIPETEMRRVFNLGIGMVLVVEHERRAEFEALVERLDLDIVAVGDVVSG